MYVDMCVCAVCMCLVDVCMVYVSYPTLSIAFLFSPPIACHTNSQVPSTVTELSGSMGLLGRGCRVEQC